MLGKHGGSARSPSGRKVKAAGFGVASKVAPQESVNPNNACRLGGKRLRTYGQMTFMLEDWEVSNGDDK